MFPNCLKHSKNVDWQSAHGRVTYNHCRVTVRRLFSKIFFIALNVGEKLFKSQRMVAWLSDYFTSVCFRTAHIRCLADVYLVILLLLLSFRQKLVHVSPPTGMVRSWKFWHYIKVGIGRREFLISAGKFQLVDSPWGEQVPHYKHRRRSIAYLLREIPVKNRERWGRSQQTGKLSGEFFCLIFASSSAIRCPNAT